MKHKYISAENFEIIENPTFFEVDEEIENEIKRANEILLNWAKNLPSNK